MDCKTNISEIIQSIIIHFNQNPEFSKIIHENEAGTEENKNPNLDRNYFNLFG